MQARDVLIQNRWNRFWLGNNFSPFFMSAGFDLGCRDSLETRLRERAQVPLHWWLGTIDIMSIQNQNHFELDYHQIIEPSFANKLF